MHIAIVGPISTNEIRSLLHEPDAVLPEGYLGAPLLSSLIKQLLKEGHTVSGITLSKDIPLDSSFSVNAKGRNFSITYCPMRPRAWAFNGSLPGRIIDLFSFEKKSLTLALKKVNPNVVHAHWAYEFGTAAVRSGFPHVITSHDSPFDIALMARKEKLTISAYRWLRTLIAKDVLRKATCVTTVSPYLQQRIQPITKSTVLVIPNPVDDLAISLAAARSISDSPSIAMVCNGWDSRKNPQPGLLAFKKLLQSIPTTTMHLYGNDFGPGQTAENWCTRNGVNKGMHFHGSVPHKQLLAELAKHDLLLHTSVEESFGMVIAEAMAMGIPVVAGEASGAVPWVIGDSGTLCDIRVPDEITRAMSEALVPENYIAVSRKGMANVIARFTTKAVTDAFIETYKTAISRSRQRVNIGSEAPL